jgi:PqqA peptide cyclase
MISARSMMIRPRNVFLVLTTDCDKRGECGYCFYNVQPERLSPSKLDTRAIVNLLKQLRLLGVQSIYLTGGEPLLRDDLETIIAEAKKLNLATFLLSNGRALDSNRVARLEKAGLDVFVLSLNGLSIPDRRTISLAVRFKKTALSFIYVLTQENLAILGDITALARVLRAGLVFQPAYIPEDNPLRKKLSLANAGAFDWSKLYTDLREWASELGYGEYLKLIYDAYHDREIRPPSCEMGTDAFVIDADGEAYPCFHRLELKCGNVRRDDIAEIVTRLSEHSPTLLPAPCFGEHCVSLHTTYGK